MEGGGGWELEKIKEGFLAGDVGGVVFFGVRGLGMGGIFRGIVLSEELF